MPSSPLATAMTGCGMSSTRGNHDVLTPPLEVREGTHQPLLRLDHHVIPDDLRPHILASAHGSPWGHPARQAEDTACPRLPPSRTVLPRGPPGRRPTRPEAQNHPTTRDASDRPGAARDMGKNAGAPAVDNQDLKWWCPTSPNALPTPSEPPFPALLVRTTPYL